MSEDTRQQIVRLNQQLIELIQQSRIKEAIALYDQVLEIQRTTLGENHPDYANSLNSLGNLYYEMGDYATAESLLRQAREILRTTLGEEHPDYAVVLSNLALLYEKMGYYAAAEPLLRQALEIQRTILGEDHPDYVTGLSNLALLYREMGAYANAKRFLLQVIEIERAIHGEDHPDYATSLDNLALLYEAMGDYAAAERLLRQVLEIRRTALCKDHPDYVNSLNNLANLYYEMGDYAATEPLLRQVLETRRTALCKDHPDYVNSLNDLANLYYEMGDYAAAEPLLCQVLEIQHKAVGEDHPNYATSLDNLALLYEAMGDSVTAKALLRQALDINHKALFEDHHLDNATCLDNLTGLYEEVGEYAAIVPLLRQALENQITVFGEDSLGPDELAGMYRSMGNYAAAEPLLRQATDNLRISLGEDHPDYATSLDKLAGLCRLMGDYAAAEPLLHQALEIRRKALGEEHPDYAISLNHLAMLHIAMGNYVAAKPLIYHAMEIQRKTVGEDHPAYAISLKSLADYYSATGTYGIAEVFVCEAIEIWRRTLGADHPVYATSLNSLAGLYEAMGDYGAAESLLRQVIEIRRNAQGKDHPKYATGLQRLAGIYYAVGDYVAAELLIRQALEIQYAVLGEDHPDYVTTLNHLAMLYVATDHETEALLLMQQVAAADDRMIGHIFTFGSESQRLAYLTTVQRNFDVFLSLIIQSFSHSYEAKQLGLQLILRRKAIGTEALAVQRDVVFSDRYPDLQPKLRELATWRGKIAQKTLMGPTPKGGEGHYESLAEWKVRAERLEKELVREIPEMNLERKLRAANLQVVAESLPADAVLVEFVRSNVFDFRAVPARGESQWQPAHYLAFVLSAEEPNNLNLIDLGEAAPLDQMIAGFRASITGGDRHLRPVDALPTTQTNDGTDLRRILFDPLIPAFAGCHRLFLSPDGELTYLPFEVLPIGTDRFLIDEYHLSYLSVGRDILYFGTKTLCQPSSPLVVADPDFDLSLESTPMSMNKTTPYERQAQTVDPSKLHFVPLPGTHAEGKLIAAQLGVRPWLKDAALKGRLKAFASPRILHIATHGFFLTDEDLGHIAPGELVNVEGSLGRLSRTDANPLLRSGLALAGANTWLQEKPPPPEAEDGILTAEDVSGLDLLATELVVLSACETGLGEVHIGEGVFGLRRAFVLAGAKTLVMSLWKVPDQQTQELMVDFYQRILDGQPRADALREAQLAMKEKHPDPFYWGAFICQGDPGPLVWSAPKS